MIVKVRGPCEGSQRPYRQFARYDWNIIRCGSSGRYNQIQQIKHLGTLYLLEEALQQYFPDISDAASTQVDALTLAADKRSAIEAWADHVDQDSNDKATDLESMIVTELKRRLRSLETSDASSTALSRSDLWWDEDDLDPQERV